MHKVRGGGDGKDKGDQDSKLNSKWLVKYACTSRIMDSPKLLLKDRFSVFTASVHNPEDGPMGRPRKSWQKYLEIGFPGNPV